MDPKIQEKVWDPKIESEIRKKWENSKLYEFQAEDGIRDSSVTGVQTCALPIFSNA